MGPRQRRPALRRLLRDRDRPRPQQGRQHPQRRHGTRPLVVLPHDKALSRLLLHPSSRSAATPTYPRVTTSANSWAASPRCPNHPSSTHRLRRPTVRILSRLIGQVAGFVFAGGSDLCHFAILLREGHVPAIVADRPLIPPSTQPPNRAPSTSPSSTTATSTSSLLRTPDEVVTA